MTNKVAQPASATEPPLITAKPGAPNRGRASRRAVAVAAAAAIVAAGCGEPEDTGPGRPVAHRRAAFLDILKAFEPMGVALRAGKYEPDRFIAMADRLAGLKDAPWAYFLDGSNYPPSHAKAAVWAEPQRFADERQKFMDAADDLVAAAATRDETRVTTAYEILHDSCRSCHRHFKR